MRKRLICCIMMIAVLFTAAAPVFAVLPQNMTSGGDSGKRLVYQEDFMHGTSMWKLTNMSMMPGRLETPENTYAYASFKDETLKLTDAEYIVKFKQVSDKQNGIAFIYFGSESNKNHTVILRNSGISMMPAGSGEQPQKAFPMRPGLNYEVRVLVTNGTAQVYIREAGNEEWTAGGTIAGMDLTNGILYLGSNSTTLEFTELTVYDLSAKSVSISPMYQYLNAGSKTALSVGNKTEKKLIFTSSDPEIAEVDENGVVTAKKGGNVEITAATEDGRNSASCKIISYVPVTNLAFHTPEWTMQVGTNTILNGQWLPNDATNSTMEYLTSDPEIVTINNRNNNNISIHAVAPGNAKIIMRSSDGIEAYCDITVEPRQERTLQNASFTMSGQKKEIPDTYFGTHYSTLMEWGASKTKMDPEGIEKKSKLASELVRDIGFQSVRSYWTWWYWRTGGPQGDNGPEEGPNKTSLERIYQLAKEGGAKQVISFSAYSSVDDMFDEFMEIKRICPDEQLYIEYGNETYAINEQNRVSTIEEYVNRLRELRKRVHEVDPTVKFAVPMLSYRLERAIFNDPGNYPDGEDNWEYTQGIRALTWNAVLSENSDLFEAVIPHLYLNSEKLRTTQQNYLKKIAKSVVDAAVGNNRQIYQFDGKEYWATEYGIFPDMGTNMQDGKSLGAGLANGLECLMLLNTDTAVTSHHYMIDPQGFGIVNGFGKDNNSLEGYLPNYYVFKELGKLFQNYKYYYSLTADEVNAERDFMLNYNLETTQSRDVQDVYAFGFGDENNAKKIAVINVTENPQQFEVKGAKLKPQTRYWGEEAYPDLFNYPGSYVDVPKDIPLPEDISQEPVSDSVELKPYSLTILDIQDAPKSEIGENVEEKLGRNVILKLDSKWSYADRQRNNMDLFQTNNVPKTIQGKVYLPLRSFGDITGQFVEYTADGDTAVIESIEYRNLSTEKENMEIDVSKVTDVDSGLKLIDDFYWNTKIQFKKDGSETVGISRVRDVDKTVEAKDAPIVIDGTTYVTPELAAEITGYFVNSYENGLIVFSEKNEVLNPEEQQAVLKEFERV